MANQLKEINKIVLEARQAMAQKRPERVERQSSRKKNEQNQQKVKRDNSG